MHVHVCRAESRLPVRSRVAPLRAAPRHARAATGGSRHKRQGQACCSWCRLSPHMQSTMQSIYVQASLLKVYQHRVTGIYSKYCSNLPGAFSMFLRQKPA